MPSPERLKIFGRTRQSSRTPGGQLRCVKLLRDGNAPHFLYAAERRYSVTVIR